MSETANEKIPPAALASCRVGLKDTWWILRRVLQYYSRDNCPLIAGAMSFFGLTSLFPLALLAISILGNTLGSSKEAEQQVGHFLHLFIPGLADSLMSQIRHIAHSHHHRLTETLGLIGLLWAGSNVFDSLERVLNHAWEVPRRRSFFRRRLVSMITFFVAAALFGVSMLVTATLAAIIRIQVESGLLSPADVPLLWNCIRITLPWVMSILMFFLLYKFLPYTYVPASLALGSALLATVLWESSKLVFAHFFVKSEAYGMIYGPLAGTILLMVWIYLSSLILLLGAEVATAFQDWQRNARNNGG